MTAFYTPPSFGWHRRPDAVAATLRYLERTQPVSPYAEVSAAGLLTQADDDRPALLWKAEEALRGGLAPSWDQDGAGTCVSFGFGRGTNDLMLLQIVRQKEEGDPGVDVATEPIYGGSRVEVGGGEIRGDGSVGAWAARWVREWGVLLRQKYGNHDLTRYSVALSRAWGQTGVPDELEPECRLHPVRTVAQVRRAEEAWRLLGNGYPVPVCSTVGFDSPLEDGFCAARGEWPHCMLLRGRLVARYRGTRVRAFCVQNSWGDYLRGEAVIRDADGNPVPLPPGCFGILWEDCEAILREGDSFALSDLVGFAPRDLSWLL